MKFDVYQVGRAIHILVNGESFLHVIGNSVYKQNGEILGMLRLCAISGMKGMKYGIQIPSGKLVVTKAHLRAQAMIEISEMLHQGAI